MRRPAGILPRGVQWRIFMASLGLQGSWNPQRMQNLGLLTTMLAWLRCRPRDVERDRRFCRRYYDFFNTNPYLANYLIGGLLRLEQERERGADVPHELPRTVRDSLARALASIGDQLFWSGLRPALVMAACLLGLYGRSWEILLLVGVFAAAQLVLRWHTLARGYRLGLDVVDDLADIRWHRAIALTTRGGMVLTGFAAAEYLALLSGLAGGAGSGLLLAGAALGIGLPLVCRRRPPGEVLVLLGLVLAVALTFALTH